MLKYNFKVTHLVNLFLKGNRMKRVLLSLLLFFVPTLVNAASVEVTDFLVDAYILENGDVEVHELVVADGTFNWFERDLLYANSALVDGDSLANNSIYNASDITNISIKAKSVNDVSFATLKDTDFHSFSLVSYGTDGSYNEYTLSPLTLGYRYRMYYYTNNSKTAFYITYTIKDAVVLHEDVAELYWTFVPDGFENTLQNVEIQVHLPHSDTSDLFRVWAHGNLDGEIDFLNDSTVYATISEVLSGESVDIRVTFNPDLVNVDLTKQSHMTSLDNIIEVENERADVANNLRATLRAKRTVALVLSWILIAATLGLAIFVFFKYGKSPKSSYYSKYNREFIDDYNVEVIDYLMKRQITPNALSASIMNLIYKKNISVNEIATENKKEHDYEFTLENLDNLNDSEHILVEFLFDKVGAKKLNEKNQKKFTTIDLKNYANGTKTCNTFISSYTKWKENVLQKGKEQLFFESSDVPKIIGIIILFVSIFLLVYITSNKIDYIPSYIAIMIAIIFFIYSLVLYKKTKKGSEHYARWNAFRNFLKDFGAFDIKELPEIILWERYLVYATIFGLAEAVEKSMNVRINEMDVSTLGYDYYPTFTYIHISPMIHASFNNAINSAYNRQAANYANTHSRSSSGGGFGGGFSSGGGFGGGGGGGRFG